MHIKDVFSHTIGERWPEHETQNIFNPYYTFWILLYPALSLYVRAPIPATFADLMHGTLLVGNGLVSPATDAAFGAFSMSPEMHDKLWQRIDSTRFANERLVQLDLPQLTRNFYYATACAAAFYLSSGPELLCGTLEECAKTWKKIWKPSATAEDYIAAHCRAFPSGVIRNYSGLPINPFAKGLTKCFSKPESKSDSTVPKPKANLFAKVSLTR